MNIEIIKLLIIILYKTFCLISGLFITFLGYNLFIKNIWGQEKHSGEITAEFKDTKLVLKKAAPGIFFALFGASIICLTIMKGVNLKWDIGEDKQTVPPSLEQTVPPGLEP